jgi:hypothetical protein
VNRTSAIGGGPAPHIHPYLRDSKDIGAGHETAPTVASNIQSTLGGATSSVANAIPTSTEDLRAQLSEARATISKLRQQEEQSLRQRDGTQDSKEHSSSRTPATGVQQHPSEGVPVQIVAALCLLSFLLAYFFF